MYISGLKERNRALNGDVVVVAVYARSEWKVCLVMHWGFSHSFYDAVYS